MPTYRTQIQYFGERFYKYDAENAEEAQAKAKEYFEEYHSEEISYIHTEDCDEI